MEKQKVNFSFSSCYIAQTRSVSIEGKSHLTRQNKVCLWMILGHVFLSSKLLNLKCNYYSFNMSILSIRKVLNVSAFSFPCINVFTRPYREMMRPADMQGDDGSLWSSLSSCQINASQDLLKHVCAEDFTGYWHAAQ